jgi:hypothetical protein
MTAPGTPFTKGIEVQILDEAYVQGEAKERHLYTGQGDIFSIHGASMKPDRPHPAGWERCLPSENRTNPAGQWNHYRVESRDGVVKLAVNGKVVSGASQCKPRKGYLCLESEGSPAQFKNIRIAELPSTNPKPEECQPAAENFTSLYTGVDLSNWKADAEQKQHWKPADWRLHYDGKADGPEHKTLMSSEQYGDFEMIVDWHVVRDKNAESHGGIHGGLCVRGNKLVIPLQAMSDGKDVADRWHRCVITLKGDRLSVLDGNKGVDGDPVSGLAPRGPIGLMGGDEPMEFASIFVRELK